MVKYKDTDFFRRYIFISSVFSVIWLIWAIILLSPSVPTYPFFRPILPFMERGNLTVITSAEVSDNWFILGYILTAMIANTLFWYYRYQQNYPDEKLKTSIMEWTFYGISAIKYGFFCILIATSAGVHSPIQFTHMIIFGVAGYFFILVRVNFYENGAYNKEQRPELKDQMRVMVYFVAILVWSIIAIISLTQAITHDSDPLRACSLGATIPGLLLLGIQTMLEVWKWKYDHTSLYSNSISRLFLKQVRNKKGVDREAAKYYLDSLPLLDKDRMIALIGFVDNLFTLESLLYSTIYASGVCDLNSCN